MRWVLVALLSSLFALLPQGGSRVTICIAGDAPAGAPEPARHSCCSSNACHGAAPAAPRGVTIDGRDDCDCCIEIDASAASPPANGVSFGELGSLGVVAPWPSHSIELPRHDARILASPHRACAARPPPRFALRI
ncbi:MAG: hypothetical protein JNL94_09585 [Planctomycetes bacterium]|nr:hypothetical protein [Planctomycetota bacterium]